MTGFSAKPSFRAVNFVFLQRVKSSVSNIGRALGYTGTDFQKPIEFHAKQYVVFANVKCCLNTPRERGRDRSLELSVVREAQRDWTCKEGLTPKNGIHAQAWILCIERRPTE